MTYRVKEIFYTLQGEGAHAGRPAVFCRFAGCNLWSGREEHRSLAICKFCDTNFVGTDGTGGGVFRTPADLADAVRSHWPSEASGEPYVVCTGGEPLLQLDEEAVAALHAVGMHVAIETNGTRPVPVGVDWVCVSPKAGAHLLLRRGDELKLVFPQTGVNPSAFEDLAFDRFSLQPMDGRDLTANTDAAIQYCLRHPNWHLSVQMHKVVGIR